MVDLVDDDTPRTVAVLGGSYGGYRAAQILASGLPRGWRVVLVDRNSHFNHVYNLPRYAVLSGHEHKAFIPYDNLFHIPPGSDNADPHTHHPHKRIRGTITALHSHSFTYMPHLHASRSSTERGDTKQMEHVHHFDYAIYALGSHLPEPINLWSSRDANNGMQVRAKGGDVVGSDAHAERIKSNENPTDAKGYTGMKSESISWLRASQERIEAARSVVVVGGGALGIQFASDIASIYPKKRVTLLHSRKRLLPRFDAALSDEVLQSLDELGVHVILGERLDMESLARVEKDGEDGGPRSVRTTKGREIEGDLVLLCTGQTPNTGLVRDLDARAIDESSGMVKVKRSMQVMVPVCVDVEEKERVDKKDGLEVGNPEANSASTLSSPRTLCGTVPPSPVETLIELDPESVTTDEVPTLYSHLFAIGDAADAFGAINAGHTAYYQGEVAARNILRLIRRAEWTPSHKAETEDDLGDTLEEYQPGPAMIKVSLGLTRSAYDVGGVVGTKEDDVDDLGAAGVWAAYGYEDVGEEGMWR